MHPLFQRQCQPAADQIVKLAIAFPLERRQGASTGDSCSGILGTQGHLSDSDRRGAAAWASG